MNGPDIQRQVISATPSPERRGRTRNTGGFYHPLFKEKGEVFGYLYLHDIRCICIHCTYLIYHQDRIGGQVGYIYIYIDMIPIT